MIHERQGETIFLPVPMVSSIVRFGDLEFRKDVQNESRRIVSHALVGGG